MFSTPRYETHNILFLPTASSFLFFPIRKGALRHPNTFICSISIEPLGKHGALTFSFLSAHAVARHSFLSSFQLITCIEGHKDILMFHEGLHQAN